MRLQPVYVEDIGQAIAKVLQRPQTRPIMFECGGPRVCSYEEFLRAVASAAGIRPILIPVPFAAWHALAWIAEMLPSPPITRNQVELMQIDSVSSPDIPGLGELGISPHSIEEILQEGNKAIVRSTITGTQRALFMGFPAKNRTMTIQAVDVHEFHDGTIVRTWHTEDWLTGLHQLGVFEK